MTGLEIIKIVEGLVSLAKRLYDTYSQIAGKQDLPSWEDVLAKNAELQEKIDAEK